MKTFILLIILSIFLPGPRKPSGSSPTGLMVEFIREPQNVLIRDPKPEFSWIVPDVAGKQTAYQILVSSSEELLERNIGDLWNGLKTTGSQSTEVEYSGAALPANSLCHWKVRIWDKRSNPSPWSAVQSFRTGTFNDYCTTANSLVETEIRPETVTRTGNDSWFVDFGKAAFGKLVLELKPVRKDTLLIHIGEKLSAKNRIDRQPGGTIRYYSVALPVEPGKTRYVAEIAPDERNTGPAAIHLPDSFGVVSPFRYCEIEKLENEPDKIIQKALWHYFDDSSSSFISSDTILNRIWDISKYTIKATSFTGIYIDGDRSVFPMRPMPTSTSSGTITPTGNIRWEGEQMNISSITLRGRLNGSCRRFLCFTTISCIPAIPNQWQGITGNCSTKHFPHWHDPTD